MADQPLKILIIRLSSIGDILLTTPFIRQIKKKYPSAQIDYVIKHEFKDLLAFNPHIDTLYSLNLKKDRKALKKLKKTLSARAYDIVFDLHNNIRSNYLRKGCRAGTTRKIHKNKLIQILLVIFKINIYKKIIPIPLRYLNVGADFHIKDDNKGLEFFWDQDTVKSIDDKIEFAKTESVICLAPGAAHYTKRWPKTHFRELCNTIEKKTDSKIVLLGGETDKELGNYLSQENHIYDFTGKLSLLETGNLMSRARALVTNDTGLMHLGTAVGIPVLALFGSTVQAFGFFPFRGRTKVLEVNDLSCRPCTHIGRSECPKSHFKCMEDIKSGQVFENLQDLLNSSINYN